MQVTEKFEGIRSELRETNRRLQAVEWQNAEVRTSLENLKGEVARFTEQSHNMQYSRPIQQNENEKLEEKVDNLVKGVQFVVTVLRTLATDINTLKTNISGLLNKTE